MGLLRFHFWPDKTGREIDCIIEEGENLIPVEIKAGQTVTEDYFKNLKYWYDLSGTDPAKGFVIYSGEEKQKRTLGQVVGWKDFLRTTPNRG